MRTSPAPRAPAAPLTEDSRILDVLQHPAFAGFARLILPWDDRGYDNDLPLRRISTLLLYHTQVEPSVVVAGLNRMVDDVRGGQTVFHSIYTAAQRRADTAKDHTGLFFFRGVPGAPFAVIAPGGGFAYVASVHEGFPYAMEINQQGYNAFVLKYRAGLGGGAATEDLAAAIAYIFKHSRELGVSTQGYSVWGSSAGARMAASIGSHGLQRFGGDALPKPSAVVMAYTAHADHAPVEPPTFVVVGEQDGIAPPATMARRVAALRATGCEVEFRRYAGVGHGFGPGTGTSAEGWVAAATQFWRKVIEPSHGVLPPDIRPGQGPDR